MKPSPTLRALVAGAIDYAGLFPPAKLAMSDAVRRYAEYQRVGEAWALGRFVLPARCLDEFVAERQSRGDLNRRWRLSAVLGADALTECAAIRRFNEAHDSGACVDSVEFKVAATAATARDQLRSVADAVGGSVHVFAEVALGGSTDELLESVRATHASAKIRTGGITPDAVPSPEDVTSFLVGCAENHLSFKATAGLHHPCRGIYPLTYDAGAPSGTMFGFLNMLLAAVFARAELPPEKILSVLEVEDAGDFWFGAEEVRWRDVRVSRAQVQESRSNFILSFGSCSFEEPIEDLRALSYL